MERAYVGNLPPDIRIKDIDDFFRPFGKLVYIDVNHRANPVYAYVQFDSARNAFNAVKSRHGYDYEGYTLQLRLVENEVRKRRDATPPPPPPPMLTGFGQQNYKGGGFNNDFGNSNNNRMGGNYSNFNSSWSNNNRSGMPQQQQNMSQYSSNNRSGMSQQLQNMSQYSNNNRKMEYTTNNRSNMQQHNLMPYSISGRSNTQQQYSNSSNRSNMQQQYSQLSNRSNMQQQNPNLNRSDMPQQYSNSNRSDMSQQYANSNRSHMSQQNMNYSDMSQQNMANYSNRSNIPQQQNMNMMDYSNNTSWNTGNNMGWSNDNSGNNYNNVGTNEIYNPNNDPYARSGYEDNYTSGLSGSGRKWFNRYIRKGFSPKIARSKALEHRTVPYLRDAPTNDQIPNDPTNMALETIGNTILSLLSTNQADNFNNDNQMVASFSNWGGDNFQGSNNGGGGNFETPGPSSLITRGKMASQTPRNAATKQQYLKSLNILKKLGEKRNKTTQDRLSKRYHTQIVKDYERLQKNTGNQRATTSSIKDKVVSSTTSSRKSCYDLSLEIRKKKQQLFLAAKGLKSKNSHFGGAFKKRMNILINEAGFAQIEAKALAVHPLEKLQTLLSLKKEYDIASMESDFKSPTQNAKINAYYNDLRYVRANEKQKFKDLSPRVKSSLRSRLNRIHNFEKQRNMTLTKSKFTELLAPEPGKKTMNTQKIQGGNKINSNAKKVVGEKAKKIVGANKTKAAAATSSTKKGEKKEELKKDEKPASNNKDQEPNSNNKDEKAETAAEEPEGNFEDQDNIKQVNEQHDEEFIDAENKDNEETKAE